MPGDERHVLHDVRAPEHVPLVHAPSVLGGLVIVLVDSAPDVEKFAVQARESPRVVLRHLVNLPHRLDNRLDGQFLTELKRVEINVLYKPDMLVRQCDSFYRHNIPFKEIYGKNLY